MIVNAPYDFMVANILIVPMLLGASLLFFLIFCAFKGMHNKQEQQVLIQEATELVHRRLQAVPRSDPPEPSPSPVSRAALRGALNYLFFLPNRALAAQEAWINAQSTQDQADRDKKANRLALLTAVTEKIDQIPCPFTRNFMLSLTPVKLRALLDDIDNNKKE